MAEPAKKKRPKYQAEDDTATGVGGMDRRRKIDDMVEEMESGNSKKRKNQSTDSNNKY